VRLSRRQFLRLAGGIGILSLPTLLGYGFLRAEEGEPLPDLSPYAPATSTPTDSPILVLTNERADNPFGPYLAEVLRAEGVNCFRVAPLSSVNAAELEKADLVLLAEGPVGGAQAELLADYVAKGGRLVAMRPDARLAFLFGVERMAGNTAEGYWQVEPGHPLGQGIAAETLQYHGVAVWLAPRPWPGWPTRKRGPASLRLPSIATGKGRPPCGPLTSRAAWPTPARATRPGPTKNGMACSSCALWICS